MIIKQIFFFSFCLIRLTNPVKQPPLMLYWITSYWRQDLYKLFNEKKFSQMLRLTGNKLNEVLCHITWIKNSIHSISFDYVQLKGINPYSIETVNYSNYKRIYNLVSFKVLQSKDGIINQCDNIEKPSSFYCSFPHDINATEIFFFDNQCYILTKNKCLEKLVRNSLWEHRENAISYLFKKLKEKSCKFRNATFIPQTIHHTSTTGNVFILLQRIKWNP